MGVERNAEGLWAYLERCRRLLGSKQFGYEDNAERDEISAHAILTNICRTRLFRILCSLLNTLIFTDTNDAHNPPDVVDEFVESYRR